MELHPKLHSQGPCGWAASTPPALYRGSMSEHFFISTLGCFYTLPRGCSRQKCRSSLELLQVHAERQVSGGRGAQSLLLSAEEVNSPSMKSL